MRQMGSTDGKVRQHQSAQSRKREARVKQESSIPFLERTLEPACHPFTCASMNTVESHSCENPRSLVELSQSLPGHPCPFFHVRRKASPSMEYLDKALQALRAISCLPCCPPSPPSGNPGHNHLRGPARRQPLAWLELGNPYRMVEVMRRLMLGRTWQPGSPP